MPEERKKKGQRREKRKVAIGGRKSPTKEGVKSWWDAFVIIPRRNRERRYKNRGG